jgi:uncharacterized protein YqfA (UPF0365 family)
MNKYKIFGLLLLLFMATTTFSCHSNSNQNTQNTEYQQDSLQTNNPNINTNQQSGIDFWTGLIIVLIIVGVVAISYFVFKYLFPVGLWFKAWIAGVRIGPRAFSNMYVQKIPAEVIILNLIEAKKANVEINIKRLEDYYLAKLDVEKLVDQMIKAHNANVPITIEQLAKVALARLDVTHFVAAMTLVHSSDIDITFDELLKFQLSGADIVRIARNKIETKNAGFPVELKALVEHALSGGNIESCVAAYISAKKADLPDVDFEDIADIDLAGYNVREIVQNTIIPRVIEGDRVRGIARDGVELSMKLKVTLRARLKDLVGSPDENTILARINESLATEIGLAENHFKVLESPFLLADRVEKKNLDEGTAFEILSVDVSDISIGKDHHAHLVTERARAEGEKAKTDVIKADEKLKKAIAAAFLDGKITVQDYEKLMNTQADTKMRQSLSDDLLIQNSLTQSEDENNIDNEDAENKED